MSDDGFRKSWAALADACPWCTVFQRPQFVGIWYEVYRELQDPVLVVARGPGGRMAGLLTLALHPGSGRLTCAGAPVAEYQTWLATEEQGASFIQGALDALSSATAATVLRFLCLAPGSPTAWCEGAESSVPTVLRGHDRPLMDLGDPSALQKSLRKKSNKSRLSKLRREGQVRLVHLEGEEALRPYFDTIVTNYDLRQGAAYGVTPFTADPQLRDLYRRLAAESDCLHVTALLAGDRLAAGHLGFVNGNQVLLGVIAHSASLAATSPGKLLIRMSAQLFAEQGYEAFDLTIGGVYKWRFATHSDRVHVLEAYLSGAHYRKHLLGRSVLTASRRVAQGLQVEEGWVRPRLRTIARKLEHLRKQPFRAWPAWVWDHLFHGSEASVYFSPKHPDLDPALVGPEVARGALDHLLSFGAEQGTLTRTDFLDLALRRLETGAVPYSVAGAGRLLYRGWLGPAQSVETIPGATELDVPEGATLLFGDAVHPEAKDRGMAELGLRARLADVKATAPKSPVLVFADPDHGPPGPLLEELGFESWGEIRVRGGLVGRDEDFIPGPAYAGPRDSPGEE